MTAVVASEDVETPIGRDLARRTALVAPAAILVAGLVRGWPGVLGAVIALAVVAGNFVASAAGLTWAARISVAAMTTAALGGYVLRLAVITAIGFAVRQVPAVDFPTFGIVLITGYLGVLVWELRSISLSFASPGLRPAGRASVPEAASGRHDVPRSIA